MFHHPRVRCRCIPYIDNLVHHHLMDLINAGQLNEPVDLGNDLF